MRDARFLTSLWVGLWCLAGAAPPPAAVPHQIHYQGRLVVDGVNFSGDGRFKFALVDAAGAATYWSHDGSSTGGGAPASHLLLPVTAGLYAVALGDAAILDSAGDPMEPITPAALDREAVFLRVWFQAGTSGFQRLEPDQRLSAVAYALVAESVPDASITAAKLASGSVTAAKLASNAVTSAKLAAGSVTAAKLAPGSVSVDKLAFSLAEGSNLRASLAPADPALLADGFVRVQTLPAPLWQSPASAGAPSPRSGHGAVWTCTQLLVWGGKVGTVLSAQGGVYDPATGAWTLLPTSDAAPARNAHTTVWTGERMILWGGFTIDGETASGALYVPPVPAADPPEGGWLATSLTNAPALRSGHAAVWTGTEMLIWGGKNPNAVLRHGGAYTPPSGPLLPGQAGTWRTLSNTNAPAARHGHTAVWTGTQMLIWGGLGANFDPLRTGALYDPATDSWTAITTTAAPTARTGHSAVWTGSHMIVFGGSNAEIPGSPDNLLADGAAYDPAANAWTPLPALGAPAARFHHDSVWTGTELLVFGGEAVGGQALNSGGAYHPANGVWRALPSRTAASVGQTAVWTGSEVLVFGDNGLETLDPTPSVYFYARF